MSYSYIKSVFPNFESSKVYNDRLYSSVNETKSAFVELTDLTGKYTGNEDWNANLGSKEVDYQSIPFKKTEVEQNKNKELKEHFVSYSQDNQHYYNVPIMNQNIPNYNNIDLNNFSNQNLENLENLTNLNPPSNNSNNEISHELYIKHILDCSKCREIVVKQFNIDADRIKHEETMELISYIIFAIFLLYLIDLIVKSK